MSAATTDREKHLRWLKKAEHWGEWVRVPDDRPGGEERVWMMRGGNGRVRFYKVGHGQQGDEHASVVAAAYWAWANGWLWTEPDGSLDILAQLACRRFVQEGGASGPFKVDRLDGSLVAS